ncbi:MAG TPA: hypothetical protein DHD79_10120 [Firmicutes bacterium]|jgi:hypothetical protein|nr:hypothetical protein [Bacillota bacterium]HBR25159.1 hypothetical protein [Bacillota bacterium]HCF90062.1 hypothetical protein [Bacillota bacterium]HCM16725.1 hypothetical protein [Bacillota bacterium]HCT36529.1 hypothetical protein [Bacillota bacterium]
MKRVILLVALMVVLAVTAGCNFPPSITEKLPAQQNLTVNAGESIHFSVVAGDWNSDPLTYKWTATGGSPISGTGKDFTWTAPGLGTYTVTVAVCDGTWTTTHYWNVTVGFKESFETGSTGWTATGLWHRQENNSAIFNVAVGNFVVLPLDDSSGGVIPNANSGQYCYWYGSPSGAGVKGNYMGTQTPDDTWLSGGTSTVKNSGMLTSPVIDLGILQNPVLQFAYWFEIEGMAPLTNDLMDVYISVNGGFFTFLGSLNPIVGGGQGAAVPHTSGGTDSPAYWDWRSYDLNEYAGKTIQLSFVFDTVNADRNGFRGWFIDDIEITEDAVRNLSAKELNPAVNRTPGLR